MEDFPNTSMVSRKEISQLGPRDRSRKVEKKTCLWRSDTS